MKRLNGKVALITGAARGIGAAIAKLFVAEGAKVLVTDINDVLGQDLASELGAQAHYLHLDVAKESDWHDAVSFISSEYGHLDVLVNNAGITGFLETDGPHDPESFELSSWRKVHQTNIEGVALGCKHAISIMKEKQSGSIINISSRSGLVGIPGAAAYASSKAAVRNHTKSVALHCASYQYGIRCNSVHPGAILTPMWDAMLGEGEARAVSIEHVSSEIPLGRMGNADDVAYGVLYLASDESKYVTGIELNIDGGILAGAAASPSANDD
ncbi:glucose 1-dehydrogenase [Thalassotalea euphylliae]|uniref:glucose 1-dehydrogenase n=1 Tax=Thalassotalea euphylliae TaxID=1655234 RepID=UPI00362B493B